MGKATIIEAQNSNTTYEQGSAKGILGKLKGVFADYKHGTRNADRLYSEELWDNRVFGSEDVMEALETKTLFGELDHPEGDRCETLAKNAAITITKLEKRPEEGVIYGEAEILDTPTGRIVKALADSGAKLGISSRGMGEEIYVEGKNMIDPETYDFITFDVVVTPANTKARVALTESKHLDKLTESLKDAVESCETINQLDQLKIVAENINDTEALNLINNKINKVSATENTSTKSTNLTEANKQIAINILNKRQKEMMLELKESKTAIESLKTENIELSKERDFLAESRTMLQTKLKESKVINNKDTEEVKDLMCENTKLKLNNRDLEKQITQLKENSKSVKESNNKLLEENNTIKAEITQLKENNKLEESKKIEALSNIKEVYNKKLESTRIACNDEAQKLMEQIDKLTTENNKLTESLSQTNIRLQEAQKLNESLQTEITTNKKAKLSESKKLEETNKLSETKTKQIESLQNENKQLKQQIQQLTEANNRYSKLPFNSIGRITVTPENFGEQQLTLEEQQLFNALTNM